MTEHCGRWRRFRAYVPPTGNVAVVPTNSLIRALVPPVDETERTKADEKQFALLPSLLQSADWAEVAVRDDDRK